MAASTIKVVPDDATGDETSRRARRRARAQVVPARPKRRLAVGIGSVLLVFAVLFAAAAIQIRLISGQRHLDRLEARIDQEQVRQDDLRQQEAMLRSPAQVTQIAANDLGMVHAAPPQMVAPTPQFLGTPEPQVTTTVALPTPAGTP